MDCKELIGCLKNYAAYHPLVGGLEEKAADAIETLLAERDALMKDAVRCDTCLHVKECCFNELRRADCAQSNRGHWQWRGPQKEGGA